MGAKINSYKFYKMLQRVINSLIVIKFRDMLIDQTPINISICWEKLPNKGCSSNKDIALF